MPNNDCGEQMLKTAACHVSVQEIDFNYRAANISDVQVVLAPAFMNMPAVERHELGCGHSSDALLKDFERNYPGTNS